MKTTASKPHMTYDDRLEIQECLVKGMTFKAIAKRIQKSPTTVSREVKLHRQEHHSGFVKIDETCPRLLRAPFVCNGCDKKSRSSCAYLRYVYNAKSAQTEYENTLVESRTGIALNKESFYETESIISEAVKNGQHVYHAIMANNLSVSTATVYRHIKKKYYRIGVLDLPRAVKFKPRRSSSNEKIPHSARIGREYENFIDFIDMNDDVSIVQLDTVIGRIGGKVIMTLHFVNSDFMVGILLENKTAAEAASKITALKIKLSEQGFSFGNIVPVLLTDNGGEFSHVSSFENNIDGIAETKLFFCEPSSPEEKPHIEKNHTLFRDIVPSGESFDDFNQDTVNLIFSHVNSVKRKQFNGKSSYEMFEFAYSSELAVAFGISKIPPKEVIQSPILLKKLYRC